MKIIRKAIYPSPCSLLFLPSLLSFFVRLCFSFFLPPYLFASRPLLLYTYIEWESCSRPWWTTCPVSDGNRGTFIRRNDRLDSNNLLILIILITSYFRTMFACSVIFDYCRLKSVFLSFVIYEFQNIFNKNLCNTTCDVFYKQLRIIFPSLFVFNEEHYVFCFIS